MLGKDYKVKITRKAPFRARLAFIMPRPRRIFLHSWFGTPTESFRLLLQAAPASYALHETRLLFMLQHPHIVELKDFYPKSSHYFIVMDFCENGDMGHHIENAIRRGIYQI